MGNTLPLVCICVPTYNAAETIKETLESILLQTYSNIVIHIVDNASTDGTLRVVESIANNRVKIHKHVENSGAEGNFNRCIQLAGGKYTAIFHADDIYEPDIVAKQVAFLEKNSCVGAVFTEASLIDKYNNKIGVLGLPRGVELKTGIYDFKYMMKAVLKYANFFICPSFMVRTEVYQNEIKIWRGECFGSGADLDVWLRILKQHHIGHIPERLMRYRISDSQHSSNVRLDTSPSALFKIIDSYLKDQSIKDMLDHEDMLGYKALERRDRVMRAVNLVLINRPGDARLLINDSVSIDAFRASMKTRSGLFTLVIGIYLQLILAVRLYQIGKKSLKYMKRAMYK
jgi:glycosyltransferase involved in cell wall biosynthesis